MKDDPFDADLRDRFATLRGETAAPPLRPLPRAARGDRTVGRRRPAWPAVAGAAAAAAIVVLLWPAPSSSPVGGPAGPGPELGLELSAWEAPSDALLEVFDDDLMTTLPAMGELEELPAPPPEPTSATHGSQHA